MTTSNIESAQQIPLQANNSDAVAITEDERSKLVATAKSWGYFSGEIKQRKELWKGLNMLDVGMGGGPHSLSYMEGGAKSYIGVDPLVGTTHVRDFRSNSDKSIPPYHDFPYSPEEIMRIYPGIHLYSGFLEDVGPQIRNRHQIDIAIMSAVSEHLEHPEKVIAEIWSLLKRRGHIWIGHCNYYSWTGHHSAPRTVETWDTNNPAHNNVVDWKHLESDHPAYKSSNFNRIRLEDFRLLVAKYFEIIEWAVSVDALKRLTPEIRNRWKKYPLAELLSRDIYITGRRRDVPLDIDLSDRQLFHPDETYLADRDYSYEQLEPWTYVCFVFFSQNGILYSHSNNDHAGDNLFKVLKPGDKVEVSKYDKQYCFTVSELIQSGDHVGLKIAEELPAGIFPDNYNNWTMDHL